MTNLQAVKAAPKQYTTFPGQKNVGLGLQALKDGIEAYADVEEGGDELTGAIATIQTVVERRLEQDKYWNAFSEPDIDQIITTLQALLEALPAPGDAPLGNEDVPLPFDAGLLVDHLDIVASFGEFEEAARYLGTLKLRIRALLNDERMKPILRPQPEPSLAEWLKEFLGDGSGSSVAVIDLSLLPSDVLEIVVAVMARMIFEALQRHRRLEGSGLPTTLVLDEAHTFVHHRVFGDEHTTPGEMCVRTFERIAREGRKFGLGLVLSSQRPSELSPTILAQCNSFLLHRLVNDRDQQLVGKLVPDNLSGLLEDLPSLPARHALLLGWASALPTLLEVRELQSEQRPRSADPDFWSVWTGERETVVDWPKVAEHWTGG